MTIRILVVHFGNLQSTGFLIIFFRVKLNENLQVKSYQPRTDFALGLISALWILSDKSGSVSTVAHSHK